jgi:hypothetical protein
MRSKIRETLPINRIGRKKRWRKISLLSSVSPLFRSLLLPSFLFRSLCWCCCYGFGFVDCDVVCVYRCVCLCWLWFWVREFVGVMLVLWLLWLWICCLFGFVNTEILWL